MKHALLVLGFLILPACAGPLQQGSLAEPLAQGNNLTIALGHPEGTSPMTLPGDYAVYRLTGSYRSEPTTIVQRVVRRQHGVLVLSMSLDDGQTPEQLQLRIDDGRRPGELLSVAGVTQGKLQPYGVEAYEARMATLVPVADENEGELERRGEFVKVGVTKVFCMRVDYRVRIGSQRGTMSTLNVDGFPGENLGGKIVTDGGSVFYHAQLVELGNQPLDRMPSGRALAASPSDLYEEIDE